MLTKQDLNAIKEVVQTEIHSGLEPIKKDLSKLQSETSKLQSEVKKLQSSASKLRKDLTTTINFFDKRDIEHKKHINKTRSELGLNEFEYA